MDQFYQQLRREKALPGNKWLAFFAVLSLLSMQAIANTYNVTTTTDYAVSGGINNNTGAISGGSGNGQVTLRSAITAADNLGGTHTINVPSGTYTLTLGEITFGNVAENITIIGTAGAASTIVSMTTSTGKDRIFLINPPGTIVNIQTTLQGLTFQNGFLTSDGFGGGAIICGGPGNAMTITSCVFSNNSTGTGGGSGGAMQMNGGGALSINQCTFSNNTCPTGDGGALYYFLPNNINGTNISGSLSITNSTFSGNTVTTSGGGSGGAISTGVQGTLGGTSSMSIQKNTFTNNHVTTATGFGGAILLGNSFAAGNTALLNYNRFAGNTATNSAATNALGFVPNSNAGNLDATNNWWDCNSGPTGCSDKAAYTGSSAGSGTLTLTPYLQLTSSASPTAICSGASNNTSTVTASFLKNSAGTTLSASNLTALVGVSVSFSATLGTISGAQTTIQSTGTATATFTSNGAAGTATVNPVVDNVPNTDATARASITVNASPTVSTQPSSNNSACNGNTITFSVTATGATSYQWYKGAAALSNGATGTGSAIAGATTATLTITNATASDNAANYNVLITGSGGCQTTSSNVSLTVAALAAPSATTNGSSAISSSNTAINDASCKRIAAVTPSGAAPISGNVTAKVTVDASQSSYNGQPYVIRHYDITPATNPNTATATLTLYFLQSDFDAYNAAMSGTSNDLPTGPSDATGKNNLRITQYHGTGTAPGNYTGWGGTGPAAVLINPGSANVVWNSTANWWEVTFSVTGFSGFYVTSLINAPLPIKLESFSALRQASGVLLNWTVKEESSVLQYEVERSTDGSRFATVGSTVATNKQQYQLLDNTATTGTYYYRLKIVDRDGRITYSNIVSCTMGGNVLLVQLSPNPFPDAFRVQIKTEERTATTFILTDQNGKKVYEQTRTLAGGDNTLTIHPPSALAKGLYFLQIVNSKMNETVKVVKGE